MRMSTTQVAASSDANVVRDTRNVINSYLQRCAIPYTPASLDPAFYRQCEDEALRRNYPMEGRYSVRTYLGQGAAIAYTSYPHIRLAERIEIALYTACAIYTDDTPGRGSAMDATYLFNERFTQNCGQDDRVLDAFADSISKISLYFKRVISNLVVTSTLNGVTAVLLEHETDTMTLSHEAQSYSNYYRLMSGFAEAYAIFAFPPELPLEDYIQAIPDMMIFINNTNDILSFYKEEVGGEPVNQASIVAACNNISKIDALGRLADAAVEAHTKVLRILSPHPAARDAYLSFSHGYIGFHVAADDRYRLSELDLATEL
ncbi:terpenoid synthase [Leucogyrophana mollusca]|uniref:Terpenoid synthase n=1 Tax=Leucogyrophana mollusca TaxID=85980 RepID=A0ACB8B6H6_9AGAM|nr:terpenoid synthase [Leucogyrophana mollusca]